MRFLNAAGDVVIFQSQRVAGVTAPDITGQLRRLADLNSSGALTNEEFAAAKERLLS